MTVILQALVAVPDAESAAFAEKFVVPRVVGVPFTAPVAAVNVSPGGSAPVVEKVYGGVPPVAASTELYGTFN